MKIKEHRNYLIYQQRAKERKKNLPPVKCDICLKMVSNKYELKGHKTIHDANRKKLNCDKCEKSFVQPAALKNHKMVIHE